MPRLTLEQHRMQRAYEATRVAVAQSPRRAKAWSTVVMPFGTHVQRDGLLQALAFLSRRATDPELQSAREAFVAALRRHLVNRAFLASPGERDFIEVVADLPAPEYMFVTREVLATTVWFKRAAQALCG